LKKAVSFAVNIIKRKSVIILISDFIDSENYYQDLKALAKRHDLVLIHLSDKRETSLPKLGIIPVQDKESGKTVWINTSFGDFREKISTQVQTKTKELADFSRKHQINFISLDTQEDYIPKLLKLFKIRNRAMKV